VCHHVALRCDLLMTGRHSDVSEYLLVKNQLPAFKSAVVNVRSVRKRTRDVSWLVVPFRGSHHILWKGGEGGLSPQLPSQQGVVTPSIFVKS
jgi:hypothetical protein